MKFIRYFHTIRHLRFRQMLYRLRRVLPSRYSTFKGNFAIRPAINPWQHNEISKARLVSPSRLRLLNREFSVEDGADWNTETATLLELYHLHYFDHLAATSTGEPVAWQHSLIQHWIDYNPPNRSPAWAPYPISRRCVNWIKYSIQGNTLSPKAASSLADQVHHLSRNLEWHVLGNHLIANAKALMFAGLFFDNENWLQRGQLIFNSEIKEQFLDDGGHFERSPMYHALMTEDLLDVINILRVYGKKEPQQYLDTATKALDWLAIMTHPDGKISLFNDAALNGSGDLERLSEYAVRLGIPAPPQCKSTQRILPESGFIRHSVANAVFFLDTGPIGPDYIPGHAHADSLGFEMSLNGRRIIVNTGTSEYGKTERRQHERSTAAHNTIEIDGENSSDVWGGFRVAQRARTSVLNTSQDSVIAEHDGYSRFRQLKTHRREWKFGDGFTRIIDSVSGEGMHSLVLRLHIHPELSCRQESRHVSIVSNDDRILTVSPDERTELSVEKTYYAPEFGITTPNECISFFYHGQLPVRLETLLDWRNRLDQSS